MAKLLALIIAASTFGAGPAHAAHPRVLLNAPIVTDLRARAQQSTPEWVALRKVCDSYKPGRVQRPDGNAYPDNGAIGAGYQGDGYFGPLVALGVCYQTAKTVDNARARRYGKVGAELVSKMAST